MSTSVPFVPGTPIEEGHIVAEVLDRHPELLETFLGLGFRPLANPLLRNTVARVVTIGRACRQLGLNAEEVVETLNRARTDAPRKMHSLPMVSVP